MKFNKLIISMILTLILCCSLIMPAMAAPYETDIGVAQSTSVARAEETKWYYRMNNGILEKRLWSITNEVWLTEWEPVEP